MQYARAFVVAAALVLVAVVPVSAGARPGVTGPDPKRMALTQLDVGYVANVDKEGYTTAGPIAASRGYKRDFSGLSPGTVQLLTIQNTVLIGKNPAAAEKLVSSIATAADTEAGRDSLYKKYAKALGDTIGSPVGSGSVKRVKAVKAGDGGAEMIFRFNTADGGYEVGEVFVRVGGNLSVVFYSGVVPGLPGSATRQFALAAAARLKKTT